MKKQPINAKDMELFSQYGLQGIDPQKAVRFVFEKGEYLYHEYGSERYIYFVVSGKAKVFSNLSDGKQLILAYFTSKGIIGDIELMTDEPMPYTTVQAVTEFACAALPLNIYGVMLRKNNVFVNCVARELAKKLIQRGINGSITTLQPLEARLCAYITQTADDGFFHETLTELAEVVGTSYRHLLRCLHKLCGDGILRKEPPGYRIIRQEVLDSKAGDLYVLK